MAKDSRFDMRMPSDVVEEIKRLAAADERPIAKYVERILRAHIDAQKGKRK